nr:MAG TPA: hypothetical protein [Caudoviricetes sp.]
MSDRNLLYKAFWARKIFIAMTEFFFIAITENFYCIRREFSFQCQIYVFATSFLWRKINTLF